MKIGFIGSGEISRFHIDALKNNKFEIEAIGTRFDSLNCLKLAKKLKLQSKYCLNGWEEVLTKDVDAFCICVDILQTPKILKEVLKLGKPVLVEKPVSLTINDLNELTKSPMKDKIYVGYNRRFYQSLKCAKQKCEESIRGGTVLVNIPDSKAGYKQFLSNGCHMVDSLRYILGDFEVIDKIIKKEINNLDFSYFSALCKNEKWNILINAHSNIPANFSITINVDNLVYELKPLEKLTIYDGIKVFEPTLKEPIRKYIPTVKEYINENSIFKPGFDAMYKNFRDFINNKNIEFCDIDDAKKTIELCLKLVSE